MIDWAEIGTVVFLGFIIVCLIARVMAELGYYLFNNWHSLAQSRYMNK